MNSANTKKIMAALWFAIAGFVPAVSAFITFSNYTPLSYFLYLALPVAIAAICGYYIGSPIITEEKITTEKQASLRGLYTAVGSYLLLVLIFLITAGVLFLIDPSDVPMEIGYLVFMGVAVLVGVLILLPIFFFGHFAVLLFAGALAGWLLFIYKANLKKLILVGGAIVLPIGSYFLWSLPNPNNIPIYPNAENVEYGEFNSTDSGTAEEKIISFQTSDSFEDVMDYYQQQLVMDGWYHPRRTEISLEVSTPSENYRIRVDTHMVDEVEIIEITLWHNLFPSFP
ncbi:MAG: hypothetical protein OEZ02_13925 [Anaerolineae bacterium]|nr:hypothetical protein [Anaerolineae bacterium]